MPSVRRRKLNESQLTVIISFNHRVSHSKENDMVDPELLKILVCPHCKGELSLKDDRLHASCGLVYRIEDDIPIMLIDEAELPEGVSSVEELDAQRDASTSN